MGDGLKPERLEFWKASDMALVELAKHSVTEIGRMLGIPPSLFGEMAHATYSNSIEMSRSFVLHTLAPFARRIAAELTQKVLTERQRAEGYACEFDLRALTLAAGKETSAYLAELTNAGIMTPNEARNFVGLPDAPEGDTLRIPAGAASPKANPDPALA